MSNARKHAWPGLLLALFSLCLLHLPMVHAQQSSLQGVGVTRIAAGATLPITVKLTNFGSALRVDVEITYKILDAQARVISSETDTVAVDTTASFVKQLTIPLGTPPGTYRAESDIQYPDQTAPATSSFEFTVARTVFGIFVSDLLLYGGITLLFFTIAFVLGRLFVRAHSRRGVLHDYSDTPKDGRIYYEIISDTISQMRLRAGDRALEIAEHVAGLSIDADTGRVLRITGSPARVVADLVSGYEAALGKKVSFALRKGESL